MTDRPGTLHLRAGDATATIDVERGGRLAALRAGGRELVLGPPSPDDRSIFWGMFLMTPWPGRLADGRFDWQGRTIQLPRTHGRHGIHGLAWARPWQVDSASSDAATLSIDLEASGWPMAGTVRHAYRLAAGHLTCEATIDARDAMPAAIGWHPWFVRGDAGPALRLRLDAAKVLETRRMIPTGEISPATGRLDLRDGPALGRRRLDTAYVRPASPAEIRWPDLTLEVAFGPEASTVVVYTPANAVCVEPQTAWPNALALPRAAAERAGVRFLAAGERLDTTMTLRWRAGRPDPG